MIKQKNVAVSIILSIITCGIYAMYWIVCMTNETRELAGDNGVGGIESLLFGIITCGIYYIYLMYKLGERIDIIKQDNKKLQYGFNYCNNCTVSIFSCNKYSSI